MDYYCVKEIDKDKFKVISFGGEECTWSEAAYYLMFKLAVPANEEKEYEKHGKEISKEEYLKLVESNEGRVFIHCLSYSPGLYTYPDGDKDKLSNDVLTELKKNELLKPSIDKALGKIKEREE